MLEFILLDHTGPGNAFPCLIKPNILAKNDLVLDTTFSHSNSRMPRGETKRTTHHDVTYVFGFHYHL